MDTLSSDDLKLLTRFPDMPVLYDGHRMGPKMELTNAELRLIMAVPEMPPDMRRKIIRRHGGVITGVSHLGGEWDVIIVSGAGGKIFADLRDGSIDGM